MTSGLRTALETFALARWLRTENRQKAWKRRKNSSSLVAETIRLVGLLPEVEGSFLGLKNLQSPEHGQHSIQSLVKIPYGFREGKQHTCSQRTSTVFFFEDGPLVPEPLGGDWCTFGLNGRVNATVFFTPIRGRFVHV